MKSKEEIMMEHCSDNGLLNMNLGKSILSAMEEYANQFQSDASSEEIRKWGKGCTVCGINEVVTKGHCNCCGGKQISFLKEQ